MPSPHLRKPGFDSGSEGRKKEKKNVYEDMIRPAAKEDGKKKKTAQKKNFVSKVSLIPRLKQTNRELLYSRKR